MAADVMRDARRKQVTHLPPEAPSLASADPDTTLYRIGPTPSCAKCIMVLGLAVPFSPSSWCPGLSVSPHRDGQWPVAGARVVAVMMIIK